MPANVYEMPTTQAAPMPCVAVVEEAEAAHVNGSDIDVDVGRYRPWNFGGKADPFQVDLPPSAEPQAQVSVKLHFTARFGDVEAALLRGRRRFDEHIGLVRDAIRESDEHSAFVTAADRIKGASAKIQALRPKIEDAVRVRDELLCGDDDAQYAQADSDAATLQDRVSRLETEKAKLFAGLAPLELALLARANSIAGELYRHDLDMVRPHLLSLCGLHAGEVFEQAVDQLVEFAEFRKHLHARGGHSLASLIVAQIVAENKEPQ